MRKGKQTHVNLQKTCKFIQKNVNKNTCKFIQKCKQKTCKFIQKCKQKTCKFCKI